MNENQKEKLGRLLFLLYKNFCPCYASLNEEGENGKYKFLVYQ